MMISSFRNLVATLVLSYQRVVHRDATRTDVMTMDLLLSLIGWCYRVVVVGVVVGGVGGGGVDCEMMGQWKEQEFVAAMP
jgi:hypothetical protein